MGLLARREHSRFELIQKMMQRGYDEHLISRNVEEFKEKGWQSNQRYAEMLIRSRIIKNHGPIKIRMELKSKGLTDELINSSLTKEINWFELCQSAWTKKYSGQADNLNDKNKQIRFLQQRGFTLEQIKKVLS